LAISILACHDVFVALNYAAYLPFIGYQLNFAAKAVCFQNLLGATDLTKTASMLQMRAADWSLAPMPVFCVWLIRPLLYNVWMMLQPSLDA